MSRKKKVILSVETQDQFILMPTGEMWILTPLQIDDKSIAISIWE